VRLFKDVILNGENLGRTFCANCAARHAYNTLHKRGDRTTTVSDLKKLRKETPEAFTFDTRPK